MTDEPPSRDQIVRELATASLRGSLGLFVGSGFSKGLTTGSLNPAPDWGELLHRVASRVGLQMPAPACVYGFSFPRIASYLVDQLRKEILRQHDLRGERLDAASAAQLAESRFKDEVASECYFSPEEKLRDQWRHAIQGVSPAWIVTTNYDTLIEELVPNSDVLLPDQVMPFSRNAITPVFHLHGHRLVPDPQDRRGDRQADPCLIY